MIKSLIAKMTLREKIGQTGMPGPGVVSKGVLECGGYGEFFRKYPYTGMYVLKSCMHDADGHVFSSPEEAAQIYKKASESVKIPLLFSCDNERGAYGLFHDLHIIASNMLLGAAQSEELTYKRSYYYARELKRCGVNWSFSPVLDLITNFFSCSGVRCFSDDPSKIIPLVPAIIRGFHDAGIAACAKHFPGNAGSEYRDSHISNTSNRATLARWKERCEGIWREAVVCGADAFMTSHVTFPAVEPGRASNGKYIPSSASKNVIDLLRKDLNFDGVVITDDCGMKSLASAYTRPEVYINCFNAGNDIVLFCRNDYIDVMEQAVKDGKVSEEQIDRSVERILKLKQKLGLFDGIKVEPPLTEEENREFDAVNYEIAKKGITLVTNHSGAIPFDPKKVKNAAIINLSPDPRFIEQMQALVDAFGEYGIKARIHEGLRSKEELRDIDEQNDMIIYSCLLKTGFQGLPWFSRVEDFNTLFHCLSYGAKKSVVVSFNAPSIYYNYFEDVGTYINAYSNDAGTMKAFVDGILGKFPFTGTSPVALTPEFK